MSVENGMVLAVLVIGFAFVVVGLIQNRKSGQSQQKHQCQDSCCVVPDPWKPFDGRISFIIEQVRKLPLASEHVKWVSRQIEIACKLLHEASQNPECGILPESSRKKMRVMVDELRGGWANLIHEEEKSEDTIHRLVELRIVSLSTSSGPSGLDAESK
jgi:hypothetical protein